MRLSLYEYTCSPAARESPLHAEGAAMLRAIATDFAALADAEVHTLLGEHEIGALPARICVHRTAASSERAAFRELAQSADAVLVIAPEFDDILAARLDWCA